MATPPTLIKVKSPLVLTILSALLYFPQISLSDNLLLYSEHIVEFIHGAFLKIEKPKSFPLDPQNRLFLALDRQLNFDIKELISTAPLQNSQLKTLPSHNDDRAVSSILQLLMMKDSTLKSNMIYSLGHIFTEHRQPPTRLLLSIQEQNRLDHYLYPEIKLYLVKHNTKNPIHYAHSDIIVKSGGYKFHHVISSLEYYFETNPPIIKSSFTNVLSYSVFELSISLQAEYDYLFIQDYLAHILLSINLIAY